MQKTNKNLIALAAAFAVCSAVIAAETNPAMQDSISTVDQLLKQDNAIARNGPVKVGAATASTQPFVLSKRSESSGHTVKVKKITAIGKKYKISMNFNGSEFRDLDIGSKVNGCFIYSVENRCVHLAKSVDMSDMEPEKGRKGKAKPTPEAQQCPTACWSGVDDYAPSRLPVGGGISRGALPGQVSAPSGPLPPEMQSPTEIPAIQNARQGYMNSTFTSPAIVGKQ